MGIRLSYLLAFIVCFFSTSAYSQNLLNFSGDYVTSNGDTGVATYTYRINGIEEEVKEGAFEFRQTNKKDSSGIAIIETKSWVGQFKNNRKVGLWEFKESVHQVNLTGFEQGEINYDLQSQRIIIQGQYKRGIPDGNWFFEQREFGESLSDPPGRRLDFNYKNGKVDGPISAYGLDGDSREEFSGQARNGLMEGSWRFNYDSTIEYRSYDLGILTQLNRTNRKGDTLYQLDFPLSSALKNAIETRKTTDLVNEPSSVLFSDGYPKSSIYIQVQQEGNELFEELTGYMLSHEKNSKRGGAPIGTNRGRYPLTSEEKVALKKWYSLNNEYNELIQQMDQSDVVDLRTSDRDTVRLIALWIDVQKEKLLGVEAWIDYLVSKKMETTYRNGILTDSAKALLAVDTVQMRKGGYPVIYDSLAVEEVNFIKYLVVNYEARIKLAERMLVIYQKEVLSLHLTQETVRIQERIEALKTELDTSLVPNFRDPSINRLVSKVHDRFLAQVVEAEYQDFLSRSGNKVLQAQLGDSIVKELKSIEAVYRMCFKIVERRMKIDTVYTEYVFDPFTYTDQVPSRVKRRLYNIIAVQMFNQMVDRAIESPTPFECQKQLSDLYALQGELIYLREINTKSLEKKLRKTKDLDERLEILNAFNAP